MSHSFTLSRRIRRLRLPMLIGLASAFAACNGDNSFTPNDGATAPTSVGPTVLSDDAPADTLAVSTDASTPASAFLAGMPFGNMAQPVTLFGSLYNGGKITTGPSGIRTALATIKARGGRVVLMMAGSSKYYKDASGHFSITKWKQRIDRYRSVNFGSY